MHEIEPAGEREKKAFAELALKDHAPVPSPFLPLIVGAALFIQTLDATVVANALPTMSRSLHEDPLTLNLVITTYLLAAAVCLPASGWLADRFGAKNIFRFAIIGFVLTSLGCGFSQNLTQMLIARALQGCAGSLLLPVGRLLVLRSVPKSGIVRAMSNLTIPALLGPVLGPPIGGFIVTFFTWRWIFFINIPIGILGLILITLFIPNIRERNNEAFDTIGFLLSAIGLAGLVFGLENLAHPLITPGLEKLVLFGGIFSLIIYGWYFRQHPNAIIDLRLLSRPGFRAGVVGGFFIRLAIGATPFLIALLLQIGFGLDAFHAGLLTFTTAIGAILMKTTASPIISRFGFRKVLIVNSFITASMFAVSGFFRATTPSTIILLTLLIGGFFRSLQMTGVNALAFIDLEKNDMSKASSFTSMSQQLAQSFGIALAAICINYFQKLHHHAQMLTSDISPAFFFMAILTFGGLFFFIPLSPKAGETTGI